LNRKVTRFAGEEIIEEYEVDVTWFELREKRDQALDESDWRFMSDQEPSQDWINYRQFLRDLPSTYEGDNANEAADAWFAYALPQG